MSQKRGAAGYRGLLLCATEELVPLIKGVFREAQHCNCKLCLGIVSVAISQVIQPYSASVPFSVK